MLEKYPFFITPAQCIQHRLVITVVAAAAALGVAGDALFNGAGAGVNIPLWIGLALLCVAGVSGAGGVALDRKRLAVLCLALGLSVGVAWRASGTLRALDLGGTLTLFGLAVGLPAGAGVRRLSLVAFMTAVSLGLVGLILGALRLAPPAEAAARFSTRLGQVTWLARALLIGLSLLFVFGGLFIAADAVFENLVLGAFRLDLTQFLTHAAWFLGCGWLGLGAIASALTLEAPPAVSVDVSDQRRLRALETAVILGPLALLFAAFVLVQVRYLFGGADLVERSISLTYAQYARRGFFELVGAAALLLPVLLLIGWARKPGNDSARTFSALGFALVGLLVVVMASAVERLRIYQDTYGLTELRLYSLAFLGCLALAFAWLAMTVLRGKAEPFLGGCLAIALLAVVGLTALSPDGVIAGTNIRRGSEGKPFDAEYVSRLSVDAVTTIVNNFDSIPSSARCDIARALLERRQVTRADWRSWSWSRQRADSAVRSNAATLRSSCAGAFSSLSSS